MCLFTRDPKGENMSTKIIIGSLVVWLLGLTFIFLKIYTHYRRLTNKVVKGGLDKVLDQLIKKSDLGQKEIAQLKKELKKIELRPCKGDADIKRKDEEVIMLKKDIYELEKEANQYAIFVAGIRSS